jgi:hypothetical protein
MRPAEKRRFVWHVLATTSPKRPRCAQPCSLQHADGIKRREESLIKRLHAEHQHAHCRGSFSDSSPQKRRMLVGRSLRLRGKACARAVLRLGARTCGAAWPSDPSLPPGQLWGNCHTSLSGFECASKYSKIPWISRRI